MGADTKAARVGLLTGTEAATGIETGTETGGTTIGAENMALEVRIVRLT